MIYVKRGACLLLAVLLLLTLTACGGTPEPQEEAAVSKTVTFTLVDKDGSAEDFKLETEKEYLADALVEAGLAEYSESNMYTVINGIRADYTADGAWWCLSEDGETMSTHGFNDMPLKDGGHYTATYTNA